MLVKSDFELLIILLITAILKTSDAEIQGDPCVRRFDQLEGGCIPLTNCPHVQEDYKNNIPYQICSYLSTGVPVVCCPTLQQSSTEKNNKRISVQKCEEYSHLTEKTISYSPLSVNAVIYNITYSDCDYSTPLIVGGEEARVGEFPHMAAIGWNDSNGVDWRCGGSLISERFVLTAAHCCPINEKPEFVRLGDNNLNSDFERMEHEDFVIKNIFKHPDYRKPSTYNDIALLELDRDVIFKKHIRPACLWQTAAINYTKTVATGWGRIEFAGPKSDELLKVVLDIIDNDNCASYIERDHRKLRNGLVEQQMCAGVLTGGKDTCQGDSGGPIQVTSGNKCLFHIVGITSFGKACAGENSSGVYTRVSSYIDWVESVVWNNNNGFT